MRLDESFPHDQAQQPSIPTGFIVPLSKSDRSELSPALTE